MMDRHEKWTPVEPGHVIPAGQPCRDEHFNPIREWNTGYPTDHKAEADWFVDSSWRPPLDLPSEPTWGIVHLSGDTFGDEWHFGLLEPAFAHQWLLDGKTVNRESVLDFIPLTPEQVARIEGAR